MFDSSEINLDEDPFSINFLTSLVSLGYNVGGKFKNRQKKTAKLSIIGKKSLKVVLLRMFTILKEFLKKIEMQTS